MSTALRRCGSAGRGVYLQVKKKTISKTKRQIKIMEGICKLYDKGLELMFLIHGEFFPTSINKIRFLSFPFWG